MKISKKEKERILKLHESYRGWDGSLINEQYQPQGGDGLGGTNTSSSGQYISGGAWEQKGPFFKTQRKAPETEVKEVDITGGNQEYKGYTQGLSIDQIPTDNQSPGNNIESTDDIGPQYAIVNTQDNGYRNPYDNDNPDPYDRQRPDPKTKPEKEWRSPPCCRPCGGGKWKRDCGELERAPGSKKSNSTGCVYNSYSDCQLVRKSLSEQTTLPKRFQDKGMGKIPMGEQDDSYRHEGGNVRGMVEELEKAIGYGYDGTNEQAVYKFLETHTWEDLLAMDEYFQSKKFVDTVGYIMGDFDGTYDEEQKKVIDLIIKLMQASPKNPVKDDRYMYYFSQRHNINEQTIGHGSGFVDNQGSSASLDKFTRRQQEMGEHNESGSRQSKLINSLKNLMTIEGFTLTEILKAIKYGLTPQIKVNDTYVMGEPDEDWENDNLV